MVGVSNSATTATIIKDGDLNMGAYALKSNNLNEVTPGHGVDVDGVNMTDNKIRSIDSLDGSVIPKKVSDNLRNSHDAEITDQTGATYVKQKTITFTHGIKGTLRVKFSIKRAAGFTAYGKVYKNGVALGAEQTATDDYATKNEDIDVGTIAAGETLELWGKAEHASALVYLKEFRCYYDNEGSAATGVNT
jgi:hypothetical protein